MLAGERAAKGRLSAQLRPVGGRRASVRVASGRACLLLRALSAACNPIGPRVTSRVGAREKPMPRLTSPIGVTKDPFSFLLRSWLAVGAFVEA